MYKPMRFWGTSAGSSIPSPFCRCNVCENARRVGGKEIRLRSAFRIDKRTMIDIGQDFAAQAARLSDDLYDIENFVITHTHDDHFNYSVFWLRRIAAEKGPEKPVNVYLTDGAYDIIDRFLYCTPALINKDAAYMKSENVVFKKLNFCETKEIGGHSFTPLKGMHRGSCGETAANYLIRLSDGRLMYYALDSGYFREETFEILKSYKLDILIAECTFPSLDGRDSCDVHMDIPSCIATLDRLYTNGTISDKTDIYLSHIEAKGMNHSELEKYFAALERNYSVKIAYDGLSIGDE